MNWAVESWTNERFCHVGRYHLCFQRRYTLAEVICLNMGTLVIIEFNHIEKLSSNRTIET